MNHEQLVCSVVYPSTSASSTSDIANLKREIRILRNQVAKERERQRKVSRLIQKREQLYKQFMTLRGSTL